MTNPNMAALLGAAAQPQTGVMRVPSQAERDEVAKVRGMQVRTAAADQATKLLAGKAPKMTEWWATAKAIEEYILGDGDGGPAGRADGRTA